MADEKPPVDEKSTPGASDEKVETKASASTSLLPDDDGGAPPKDEGKKADPPKDEGKKPDEKKDPPAEEPKWFYADGTPGKGEAPVWFKADKYKSVEEQAKAYPELEKRLGAFKGAPKDGKYAPPTKLPEGIQGEFDASHPLFQKFGTWALDQQFSQESYEQVLGMFAEYEAGRTPDRSEILREIGDGAETRLASVAQWAKANLPAEEYKLLRTALEPSEQTANVVRLVESLIAKTKAPGAKKPGDEVVTGIDTQDSIAEEQGKINPQTGKRFYDENPEYRAKIEKKWLAFFDKQAGKAA
jgi:hypothetical protein